MILRPEPRTLPCPVQCSAYQLKAGKEDVLSEGYGVRPYEAWERVMIPCEVRTARHAVCEALVPAGAPTSVACVHAPVSPGPPA